jgi:hypothetical protein
MRFVYQAFVLAFALLISPLAKADTLLLFDLSGAGSTYTFSLDSTPPIASAAAGFSFTLNGIDITIDDLFGVTSGMTFFNGARGGGVSLLNIPGGALDLTGPQLYSGSETTPSFGPGGPISLTDSAGAPFSLTITAAPTPEPGTLTLLATGAIATLGSIRRRRRTVAHT